MNTGLKRSGTLQAPMPANANSQNTTPPDTSEAAEEDDYGYDEEDAGTYDDEYVRGQQQQYSGQYAGSPIGRHSPWAPSNEWRATGGYAGGNQNPTIDDVQRALSTLELASNNQGGLTQAYQTHQNTGNYQAGQSAHPPRFNPTHPPPAQAPGMRNNSNNGNGSRQPQDLEGRKTPQSQGGPAYMQQQPYQQQDNRTPSASGSWSDKDRILGTRTSNPNLQYGYQQGAKGSGPGVPNVPQIPQQYLQQQTRMGSGSSFGQGGGAQQQGGGPASPGQQPSGQGFANTPIDVPSLIATKGYNPTNFEIRPQFVRQLTAVCRSRT